MIRQVPWESVKPWHLLTVSENEERIGNPDISRRFLRFGGFALTIPASAYSRVSSPEASFNRRYRPVSASSGVRRRLNTFPSADRVT